MHHHGDRLATTPPESATLPRVIAAPVVLSNNERRHYSQYPSKQRQPPPATPNSTIFRRTREPVNSAQLPANTIEQPTTQQHYLLPPTPALHHQPAVGPHPHRTKPSNKTATPLPRVAARPHHRDRNNSNDRQWQPHLHLDRNNPSTPASNSTNPLRHTYKGAIINPRRGSPIINAATTIRNNYPCTSKGERSNKLNNRATNMPNNKYF
jgi:hypothetical protein